MFFDGDHSQSIGRTLWVIEPDGNRTLLASGFVLYISLTAARKLTKFGIPFRAVSFYEATDGQIVEDEISISPLARFTTPLLGLSNLWFGAVAGAFLKSVGQIVAFGVLALAVLAVLTLRSATSKRAASLTIALTLMTYVAGYLVAVVLVRSVLSGFTGR